MKPATADMVRASKAWVENGCICVALDDEREIRFPAAKSRRLAGATPQALANMELICDRTGIHWPELDEDLSITGILDGRFGQ
jgi:hypothetical protein